MCSRLSPWLPTFSQIYFVAFAHKEGVASTIWTICTVPLRHVLRCMVFNRDLHCERHTHIKLLKSLKFDTVPQSFWADGSKWATIYLCLLSLISYESTPTWQDILHPTSLSLGRQQRFLYLCFTINLTNELWGKGSRH